MIRTDVAEVLIDIESELRQFGLWDRQQPPTSALESTEPFCVDTLTFPQWLQFIFLPTLYRLLEAEAPLPARCGIAPMAHEYFKGVGLPVASLEEALLRMDVLLSDNVSNDKDAEA